MKEAFIKLHIAVFFWGFTGILGRLISVNEGLLVWYRLIITVTTLYLLMRRKRQVASVPGKQRWQLLGIGVIIALHWVFFYGSIKYANVSIALTCLSAAGLFTALLEPLLLKRRADIIEVVLGLIGISGIYIIFHFDPRYKTGILLGIICTILTCLFSVLNKKQVATVAPRTMMLYELLGGLVFMTLIIPIYLHFLPSAHVLPSVKDLIWLLLLSWLCTILAMDLSLQALKKISAFTQMLTLNLEPVYGIILAFIVFKENKYLSEWFYAGFALIILAVVLQMLRIVRNKKRLEAGRESEVIHE